MFRELASPILITDVAQRFIASIWHEIGAFLMSEAIEWCHTLQVNADVYVEQNAVIFDADEFQIDMLQYKIIEYQQGFTRHGYGLYNVNIAEAVITVTHDDASVAQQEFVKALRDAGDDTLEPCPF